MRHVVLEKRACGACGAFATVKREDGGACAGRRGGTFFRDSSRALAPRVPRERSGLAHAAGFAGLLSLFRYSFAPLVLSGLWPAWALGTGLVLVFNLLAPLAVVLSFAAAVSLDRSPRESGRLPALFGLIAGWCGSYALVLQLDGLWQLLAALG